MKWQSAYWRCKGKIHLNDDIYEKCDEPLTITLDLGPPVEIVEGPCQKLKSEFSMDNIDFIDIDEDAQAREVVLKHTRSVPFMIDSNHGHYANGYDDIKEYLMREQKETKEEE